jgi:hypothetical protein
MLSLLVVHVDVSTVSGRVGVVRFFEGGCFITDDGYTMTIIKLTKYRDGLQEYLVVGLFVDASLCQNRRAIKRMGTFQSET